MPHKSTLSTSPATQVTACALAAPAASSLGVCAVKGQSGAGMLNTWHSISTLVEGMPQRGAAATGKRSAGAAAAAAESSAINFGGCVASATAVPDGNHGDNF